MHPRAPRGFTASLFFAAAWLCGAAAMAAEGVATATFAGGCFWCMEPAFDKLDGVKSVVSGYTGGATERPTYEQVSAGATGHAEAVKITYDPSKITFERLLDVFWHNIDPVTANQQFCDHGTQYRSAIFYHDERQRQLAEASRAALEAEKRFARPIVPQIVPASILSGGRLPS